VMSPPSRLLAETTVLPRQLAEVAATLPPHLKALVEALPRRLVDVLASVPVYSDRRSGAILLTRYLFPVSHRSLETWPLPWQHANGRSITPTVVLFAVGHAKLDAAPVIMGGRRAAEEQFAA